VLPSQVVVNVVALPIEASLTSGVQFAISVSSQFIEVASTIPVAQFIMRFWPTPLFSPTELSSATAPMKAEAAYGITKLGISVCGILLSGKLINAGCA
jgi:hypothetical protein